MSKVLIFLLFLTACAQNNKSKQNSSSANTTNAIVDEKTAIDTNWTEKIIKTDAEWRKILTKAQYEIAREHGTERAFTSEHYENHKKGVFICVACNNPLFSSKTKFDSGTGWPSFYDTYSKKSLGITRDNSYGMVREEVHCLRCEAHLGHVFDDGPKPTGLRYCIDGIGLKFIPQ